MPSFSSRVEPLTQTDIWQGVLKELQKLKASLPNPATLKDSGRDSMDSSKYNFRFTDGSVCTVRIPSTFHYALTVQTGVGIHARLAVLTSLCEAQVQYCIGGY